MYHYFVSYRYKDRVGNCEITRNNKINCLKDIQSMEDNIEQTLSLIDVTVVITNYILLRTNFTDEIDLGSSNTNS